MSSTLQHAPSVLMHHTLRAWQVQAFEAITQSESIDFLAVATPGAGKTKLSVRVVREWLDRRIIQRVIVVCPTNHLKGQWARAASASLNLDPTFSNDQTVEARDYHGIVVSYQQVCMAPALYARLCQEKRTAVVFDEIHHAGDGKGWGEGLRMAFASAVKRLATSGTPFRSDDNPIPYVRYEEQRSVPDFTYGYGEALRDGVCRRILFPAYEGQLSWRSSDGYEVNAATFGDLLNPVHMRERLKTAIMHRDWLGVVISDADRQLSTIREQGARDAGGLVVAMNQAHAHQVAALILEKTGRQPRIAISDEPAASHIIKQFASSGDRWMVAVNMVSEGVDIPRLRVGIYATNVMTEMYFRQVVGRFVRMQAEHGRRQQAYLYIPHDPTLVEYAMAIEAERDHYVPTPEEDPGTPVIWIMSDASPSAYLALAGIAQAVFTIGVDVPPSPPVPFPDPAEPLHEVKGQLRETHRRLVGRVSKQFGLDHRAVNLELHKRTGGWIDTATMTQLKKRVSQLESWLKTGYDGARS
ncbi:MAG: DEAD/DEAH box helicase family protein [Nitrospirota bacterium]|nr:DEAD/DEAH box helicase family protein [Nitrospirota bacterium]